MFSIIANQCLPQLGKHAEKTVTFSFYIDTLGWITLLVLGALATSGHGTDLINHLNPIAGVNCGGGLMIGGAILTWIVASVANGISVANLRNSTDTYLQNAYVNKS